MTFPILIEVEDSALGSVLKLLHGYPGIAKLHLDLDAVTAPRGTRKGIPNAPRKQRGPGEPSSSDVTIAFLMKNGAQRNTTIGDELTKHGFAKTSSPSVLNTLKEKGIVQNVGNAMWDLTDEAKAKIGGAPKQALAAPSSNSTGHDIVIEKMKSLGGTAKRLELAQALSDNSHSSISIDRIITELKKRHLVIVDDGVPGTYHLAPQSNGAAPAAEPAATEAKPKRGEKRTAIAALLRERNGPVSSADMATALGVAKGSIDGALFRLRNDGIVKTVSPGVFELTKKGMAAKPPITTTPQE